ncbi:DUF91 domain-containing protein [Kaustia mangrovi]|uniref:DUF91 domain-containing protein n=1 Tax=Kaustia mangrovi TaxID=2593653 RepID=A0A7S8C746_9HYPH|nr:endonuclease NucS domain-containing protein [Kaustia mangrovi]QPC44636.1 DUF91 domain-containing protein [Kaustia mangrovi]
MVRKHFVVTLGEDGRAREHRLKSWLRAHPEEIPPGLDPHNNGSTSHMLRNGLRKMGWIMEETATKVLLFRPGVEESLDIEEYLGPQDDVGSDAENSEDEEEGLGFQLEEQLRDFLANNLDRVAVDGRRLRLFQDETGRSGIEYPTAVGWIDILAVDTDGAYYVFELKRAQSPDSAIGQVARYMGWVKQTIAGGRPVNGVIVAKTISEKLRFARTVVPNIFLFEYQVSFTVNQAHDIAFE